MAGLRKTKKSQVIKHLLLGNTVLVSAQKAGVTERTVYRWLSDPGFVEEIHHQERQVLEAVSWRLISLTKKALDALQDVLDQPSQPGAMTKRLAAAQVLDLVLKWRDQVDFEERLTKIEEFIALQQEDR